VDWRDRSACLDKDPDLFFPVGKSGLQVLRQIEEATSVCRRCDVREECLAWAIASGQEHGVWGGTGEEERRSISRRAARARLIASSEASSLHEWRGSSGDLQDRRVSEGATPKRSR
jgi:WhiB family redox-sensing transcriptional regulator